MQLKQNFTLGNIFQGLTYSSFQKLADAYLQEEVSPSNTPLTVLPTAPELVKLAFTLDFTARIAALSRHNISHITSLGNRYLLDRFEYKQVRLKIRCEDQINTLLLQMSLLLVLARIKLTTFKTAYIMFIMYHISKQRRTGDFLSDPPSLQACTDNPLSD